MKSKQLTLQQIYENHSILNIQETKHIEMTQHNSMIEIVNG